MSQSPTTRFGLVRHALTEWNREKRIQGQSDTQLSLVGKRQAAKWGRVLKAELWDRILTSDARRAWETARSINAFLKVPMESDPRLREQDWGAWTGKTLRELKREAPQLLSFQEQAGWDFCPPGGEDRRHVQERSMTALGEAGEKWAGERILVVTHEGVIKCLVYGLLGRLFLPGEAMLLHPRSLHWLSHDQEGLRVEEINALALP